MPHAAMSSRTGPSRPETRWPAKTHKQAFVFGAYGHSTAVALVLAIPVAAIEMVQLRYLRGREVTG
jgi:raffinose/stachyose/melibiose transport system permease protein